MKKIFLAFIVALIASGCASRKPKEPIGKVCLEVYGISPQEVSYVKKSATKYLAEKGFSAGDEACEAVSIFRSFGGNTTEEVSFNGLWVSRNGYKNHEGNITIKINGNTIIDEEAINLRGYSTKQDLLSDLGWYMIKPIIKNYSPK